MTVGTLPVDSPELFEQLSHRMASEVAVFERLGDVEIDLALVMMRPGMEPFHLLLRFSGVACTDVLVIRAGQERDADCWLEGTLADWEEMFSDIRSHGHATGPWTLNALTLFGDRISLHATDPVGEDRFHRFNQTLQEFFDGAAHAADHAKE